MSAFIYIFTNIMLPILALIAVGFVAQKKLKMDSRTFSRINIYILVPPLTFLKIYEANVSMDFIGIMLLYLFAMQIIMYFLGELIARALNLSRGGKKAFSNSLVFFNSGNYGLPLVDLAFKGNPIAVASQVLIMLIQNVTINTFGVFQTSSGKSSRRVAIRNMLAMPSIYVILLVLLVKVSGFQVADQALKTMGYIANGFIGLALVTLGVQLAEVKVSIKVRDVLLSSLVRLVVSPIIGYVFVRALGVEGILAQSMIIGVATPVAVNTAILAREFDNEPEYASQIVFVSTVLSTVTIPIIIYLVTNYL